MTALALLASSPISIITSDGKQHNIPLSLLALKNGAIDASRLDAALAAAAAPTFKALLASGALRSGTASTPVKAMDIVAKLAGELGNAIELTFADVKPDAGTPAATTCDLTVTFSDRRPGLTAAAIGVQLGAPSGGTAPSLVTLTAVAAGLPAATPPTKLTGTPRTLDIALAAGGGTAFTVKGGAGTLLADVTVAIEDVDTVANSFTLVIGLNHAASDIALSAIAERLAPIVTVTAGSGGFAPPAQGIVKLKGGTPARTVPPVAARAEILSG
jgi:hypothetical protein